MGSRREWSQEEILRAIRRPGGLKAGWSLTAYETSDWNWGRIVPAADGSALRVAFIRDCTEDEKCTLNYLLWTAQIVMRFRRIRETGECPWAFASIM